MSEKKRPVGIRLDVTPTQRDRLRIAAALAGYSSMADFNRAVTLQIAELFQLQMAEIDNPWWNRLLPERRAWMIEQLSQDTSTSPVE